MFETECNLKMHVHLSKNWGPKTTYFRRFQHWQVRVGGVKLWTQVQTRQDSFILSRLSFQFSSFQRSSLYLRLNSCKLETWIETGQNCLVLSPILGTVFSCPCRCRGVNKVYDYEMANDSLKRKVLSRQFNVIRVSQSRMLSGTEFQMVAAECLKAWDATFRDRVVTRRSWEAERR